MSRKHFVALAASIRQIADKRAKAAAAHAVADACRLFNGHFDRSRFLRACGVE